MEDGGWRNERWPDGNEAKESRAEPHRDVKDKGDCWLETHKGSRKSCREIARVRLEERLVTGTRGASDKQQTALGFDSGDRAEVDLQRYGITAYLPDEGGDETAAHPVAQAPTQPLGLQISAAWKRVQG